MVNLAALLVVGVIGFLAARFAGSLAGQVAMGFAGIGVLVAAVSWFQMRLEEAERNERLELDELARTKSSATLFEAGKGESFPAQRAREQFEKYLVPAFTLILLALQAGGAYWLWRWLKTPAASISDNWLIAASYFGTGFLILFIVGRFSATITRIEDHRLLRPGASFTLLTAFLCFLTAGGIAAVHFDFQRADLFLARGLVIVLAIVALETLLALILELYRPRMKGRVGRPLYDSRFVGLLGQPESLITTAAQALDYQFGFKVSETWFYNFFARNIGRLVLIQIVVFLVSSCFVIIESGEQALLERFGKPVKGREVLGPGPHFTLPWPVERVYRFRTDQLQTVTVGFAEDDKDEHASPVILWSVGHGKEDNFLVANRETTDSAGSEPGERKAPPVSLLTVNIPIQFQVTDLVAWAYNHTDSASLLQRAATREVVRHLVSADLNEIMSRGRDATSETLRARIQAAADGHKLGAKILFVGLQGIHPPVKVAPEYTKVVAEYQRKQARILSAQAEAISTNASAGARSFTAVATAESDRYRLEMTAVARAAAFTNQIPAFNAAPSVYMQRAYFQTFARATEGARKYVLLATNTHDVIEFDLKDSVLRDYGSLTVPAPKK
jgi:membrane protease subunit HflK